jgi:hypothetical protein
MDKHRYIFSIFCLIGYLYQTYQISKIYFSYETTTDVSYENEDPLSIPAITLCGIKSYFLREEYQKLFPLQNQSEFSSEREQQILNYLSNLTIKDQLKALYSTQNMSTLINCTVLRTKAFNGSERSIDCKHINRVKISIDDYFYCFTYFSQIKQEYNDSYMVDMNSHGLNYFGALIRIIYPFKTDYIYIYIHSTYESVIENHKLVPAFINTTYRSNFHDIFYQKTTVQLLGEPYKTSCTDNNLKGYKNSFDCISKCKIDNYFQVFNKRPKMVSSDDLDNEMFLIYYENKTLDYEWNTKCQKVCGKNPECFKEYFIHSIKSYEYQTGSNDNDICIYPPISPNTKYTQLLKVSIEQFLGLVASLISLWFGFSILMLSDVCLFLFNNMKRLIINFKIKISQIHTNKNVTNHIQIQVNNLRMLR